MMVRVSSVKPVRHSPKVHGLDCSLQESTYIQSRADVRASLNMRSSVYANCFTPVPSS